MEQEPAPNFDSIRNESTPPANDELAQRERVNLINDHSRKDRLKMHLTTIAIVGVWVAGIIVMALFLIRAWHFAAPSGCCWLDNEKLHDIERIIFSSALLAAISFYLKNIFNVKGTLVKYNT